MKAHAPGSITCFFAPPAAADRASRGASVAVADGVVVDLRPADRIRVTVDGRDRSFEPVERVLAGLGVTATVDVTPEVPIGHGFGASGAATIATALAANGQFDLGLDRESVVHAAHRAEVAAGTGLGDVFIQDRGGVVWSADGGRRRLDVTDPVEYVAYDGIATASVLSDRATVARLREAGSRAFEALSGAPTVRELVERGWAFARETGLPTDRVTETVEGIEAAGGAGSMAMLGETVFAVGVDGVLEHRTRVATEGVRVVGE